jgi:hypothetical protein
VSADCFTTGDVARALDVTREGVRYLVREARLQCRRMPNGLRMFEEAEVLRLAQSRDRARLHGVRVLRPKKFNVRGEPSQLSLFGLTKVK